MASVKVTSAVRPIAWHVQQRQMVDRDGPSGLPCDAPGDGIGDRSLWTWFDLAVRRNPAAPALAIRNVTLSYAQMRDRVLALSACLVAQTDPQDAIAVVLPQSPDVMIAVVACLAAGRVCLLLNAEHPAERNAQILTNAQPTACIVASEEVALPECGVRVVMSRVPPAVPAFVPPDSLGPDQPALVIYTSGSTGRPKGIVSSQRGVLIRADVIARILHLHSADMVLSLSAMCTVSGFRIGLATLLAGACQLLVPINSPGTVQDLIEDFRVSVLAGLPAVLRIVMQGTNAASRLACLRVVRTGAGIPLRSDIEAWRRVLRPDCYINVNYGLTEASATTWYVPRNFALDDAALPLGRVIEDIDFAVLDPAGEPVANGQVGELVLRSVCMALGEWEAGQCNPGRMLSDSVQPGWRILFTGDLVHVRPDGLLQFDGRVDRQIKINGQRIEPAEIEEALRRITGVTDAAVVARQQGEQTVLAGFVVGSGAALDPAHMRTVLRDSLPAHMVPTLLLTVRELPRLPGGKVDEKRLLVLSKRA
jgi:amino acid adenylation domain-containing protein